MTIQNINHYDNDGMSECKGWIFNIVTLFFKRKRNFNLSKVDLVHDFLIDCVRWLAAKVFSVQTFECQANVDLDNLLTNFTMLLMICKINVDLDNSQWFALLPQHLHFSLNNSYRTPKGIGRNLQLTKSSWKHNL